jgi:hypothetical protein
MTQQYSLIVALSRAVLPRVSGFCEIQVEADQSWPRYWLGVTPASRRKICAKWLGLE